MERPALHPSPKASSQPPAALDSASFKPLYMQVFDYLLHNIEDGTWPVGALIPSENQLVDTFKISRNTARQALDELVKRGYVYRVAGKGTFVASSTLDQRFNFITGFSEDVRSLGMLPDHQVIAITPQEATPLVAAKLQVAPGSPVLRLHRLLLANELPYIVATTYFPLRWLELQQVSLTPDTLGRGSLYAYLEQRHGIVFTQAVITIRAGIADAEETRLLGLHKGSPVLRSERVACTSDNVPREYTLGAGHPDRHQWTTILYKKSPSPESS